MKKKEFDKLKGKSVAALEKELAGLLDKLHKAKESIQKGKEKNVHLSSALKKSIAQVKTLLSQAVAEEKIAKEEKK